MEIVSQILFTVIILAWPLLAWSMSRESRKLGRMEGKRDILEIISQSIFESDIHASRSEGIVWTNMFWTVFNKKMDEAKNAEEREKQGTRTRSLLRRVRGYFGHRSDHDSGVSGTDGQHRD